MEAQNNNTRIEAYLMGHMNEAERLAFEQQLAENTDLAAELEEQRQLVSGMEFFGKKQMKEELQAIHREVIEGKGLAIEKKLDVGEKPRGKRRFLGAIGAVAAILLLLLVFWFNQPAASPQQLYAAHYEAFELPSASRDATEAVSLAQAKAQYDAGNYSAALPLFEQLLQVQPNNIPLLLAAGNAQLQLDQPAAALPYFVRSLATDDLLFRDQARWYAGMVQLKLGMAEPAREYFAPLANDPQGDYYEQAKAILKALK